MEAFRGIGLVVAQLYSDEAPDHRGDLVVLATVDGSPAALSGIRPGTSSLRSAVSPHAVAHLKQLFGTCFEVLPVL
jgi:hypothetical protein